MCVCARASDVCVCVRFRCVFQMCARALQMCVCVCALQMCACVSDVCVRARACVCALQMCVFQMCARASDVCVCVCVCVCVRALQMCAWETSHTALNYYSNNPKCLLCSPRAFRQCLYRVLIREIEREYTRWW